MSQFTNHIYKNNIDREILEDTLLSVCQQNEGILDMCINHLVSTLSNNEVERWDELVSTNFWDTYEEKCIKRHANPVAQDHNKEIAIVRTK